MSFAALSIVVALTVSPTPASEERPVRHDAPVYAPFATTLDAAASDAPAITGRQALTKPRVPEAWMTDRRESRPAVLPAMYAALGALQVMDVYSTRRAMGAGASEANPVMKNAAGGSAAMLAVKAASTVGTIFFAERAWKKNRTGAVVLMAVINGATAAIAAHNMKNASR